MPADRVVSRRHPARLVFAVLFVVVGLAFAIPGLVLLADADDRLVGLASLAVGIALLLAAIAGMTFRLMVDQSGVTAKSALRTRFIASGDLLEVERRFGRGGAFYRLQSRGGSHIDFHPSSVTNAAEIEVALRALSPFTG